MEDAEQEAGAPSASGASTIKALILDFDSTISSPTYLARANAWAVADNRALFASMSNEEICANFGGAHRIAALKALLGELKAAGVHLGIISIGFREALVPHLEKAGLLHLFELQHIFGQDSPELRAVGFVKARLIAQLMRARDWDFGDVLFVDDSPEHIEKASATCKTLLVPGGGGMAAQEFAAIRQLAGTRPAPTPLLGQRVAIKGIENRPELNGATGLAREYSADKQRYAVKLDASGECVLLRAATLEPLPPHMARSLDLGAAKEFD